jgi:uncharacterized protein (DUF1697 family)
MDAVTHVALLRGINVGGSNRVNMKELKTVFEAASMQSVKTYINSGNVLFSTNVSDRTALTQLLEQAIAEHFGFPVSVLPRDVNELRDIVNALPEHWTNDETTKCDVMFLWDEVDRPSVLEQLDFDPEVEDVRYTPGAVIRCIARKNATRSRLPRIVGTPLYQRVTIRNCNTARKLLQIMEADSSF